MCLPLMLEEFFKSVELVRELTVAHREQYYQNSGRQQEIFIVNLLLIMNRSGVFDRDG